ncbi:GerAB/ArcD/ProY family transporter [Gottfriedia solisilvae]|nr:endospore germination permease [Gottfriedia solisilvae]
MMNRKLSISGFQLFCMIFLFEGGTTSVFGLAHNSKQDGWISIFISLILCCILLYVYLKLYEIYPSLLFTKYIQLILGEYAGKVVALIYIVYFLYIAARDLRDFEEVLVITLYNSSSIILIGIIMMSLIVYSLYKGLETFARANEVIFMLIVIMLFFLIGAETISKLQNFNNLRPVLENGIQPILKDVFPITLTFPFGELITFTMIFPYVNKTKKTFKIGFLAIIVTGILMIIFNINNIAILGASLFERTSFPLLTAVSFVNIAHFIQRLDTFVIMLMVFGGFIKITIFFYCALSGSADLFNVKKTEKLIYPLSIIIIMLSLFMAPNYLEHIKEGFEIVPYYLHIPLQVIIPVCLLLIVLIQRKIKFSKK